MYCSYENLQRTLTQEKISLSNPNLALSFFVTMKQRHSVSMSFSKNIHRGHLKTGQNFIYNFSTYNKNQDIYKIRPYVWNLVDYWSITGRFLNESNWELILQLARQLISACWCD